MRTIPETLAAHLAGDATTTCQCWRVTRRDGTVLGFTDHDRDLRFARTLFLAASGFNASETEAQTGLSVDASDIAGGFSSAAIREEDLVAGRYDGARIEVYVVNWREPEQHMLLKVQEIGEVSRDSSSFRAELRSFAHRLGQPQGRIYARRCDATLGDRRCGVDLAAFRGRGTVASVADAGRMTVKGLGAFAGGYFSRGVLTFTNGTLSGTGADIEAHRKTGGGVELSLWLPLPQMPQPGDTFEIVAGCDKSFATCRKTFDNHLNFQGFPHIPGSDFAYSYADGQTIHDGRALF